MNVSDETTARREPTGRVDRLRRRWVVGITAVATALSGVLVAVPASAAGTPPQITTVASSAGTLTVTLGHPRAVKTAKLSAQAVAYNSANGDEAVAVITGTGQSHIYLVAGATEPNEYHIQTAPGVFGTLVKGDAYLVAGNGTRGMIADPGATTTITGGSTSPLAVTNPVAPISLAFDHSGNLLYAGNHYSTTTSASGIQLVAKTTCTSSCGYGYSAFGAGNLYSVAGVGMRGLTRTPAISFTVGVLGYGLAIDAQGNLLDSTNGFVVYVNVGTTSVTRYGRTIAGRTYAAIAGTGTTGAGKCAAGGSSVTGTGSTTSPNLQVPHPYLDASGNVYVNTNWTEAGTSCVWVLPAATGTLDGIPVTAGRLYSLTGPSTGTAFTNGAVANEVSFTNAEAVVTDPAGNLVVSTSGTHPSVRVIAESTGKFYGQTMTKGHAYLISGGPTATRVTTPGDATGFEFVGTKVSYTLGTIPYGITSLVNGAAGNVLLANGTDGTNGTVYQITGGPTTAPPTVTKVTPDKGPEAGGTTVTVTGTNFTSPATVDFGTTPGTSVTVKSPTQLTVVDPAGTGTVAASVTDADGTGQLTTAFTYVAKPTVTNVTPTSGPAAGGTTVTVTGTNFTTVTAVDFGTKPGTSVTVKSPTQLTVVDPEGTGTVPVSVTALGGTGKLTTAFTYIPSPKVTKVSPNVGPLAGGTTVTVTGANFTSTATVDFGTTPGTSVTVKSPTELSVVDPAGTGTVPVKVTTSVGTGQLTTAFTYVGPPTATKVTPDQGPEAGGTTVTVTGTNFTSTATVDFGTTPGTSVTVKSPTQLTVVDPTGTGTVSVSVTAAGGGPATLATAFTYVAKPTVTNVTPTSGPAAGGTTVTVTGTNFTTVTAVDFGTKPGSSVTVKSPTQLTVVDPEGTGTVPVSVTALGGTGKLTTAFTYIPSPTVTKVTPDKGPLGGGTPVTVTGTNFTTTATVDFGTTAATTVHVTSSTKLTVVDPAGTGTVAVTVATSVGTGTLPAAFTYVGAPTITTVTPGRGPETGGTPVTITGTNLTTASKVEFGTTEGTSVHATGSTKVTVDTPTGTGTVAVTVTAAGGIGTVTTAFTYVAKPTVTKVTPTSGPAAGGTTVTVTGTNFTTVTAVDFGTKPGTSVTVKSPTQLTVVDPTGTGKVDVSVNALGGTGTLATAFTYIPAPTVTKVTPDKGPATSTKALTVTVTGANFTTVTAVTLGKTPGTTVHVTNATKLTVVVPEQSAGPVTVSVTTAIGGTGVLPDGFTYVGPPTITKLSPDMGPTSGGTTVTITGTNLTTASTVHFGFALGTSVHVISSTQLTVVDPAGTPGPVSVTVTALGGRGTLASAFTYIAAPTVTKVSPTSGPAKGGTTVTVTGSNFTTVTTVDFGSSAGTSVTVKSATQLTVVDPAGSGTVAVSVSAIGGTGKLTNAFSYTATPTPPPPSTKGKGYWEVASDGGLFAFGAAQFYGSMGGQPLNQPIVGMTATPTGKGYWEVASDGGLFAFGSAQFYGSMGGRPLNQPIVGMTATPTGKGYWEVASDGGLFAFGAAQFYGSMGGQPLNQPIVGMTATPTGKGYWEVASDGGLFAFGAAQFYGSMGGQPLNQPIVGMTATPTGKGYWEVASDGGLFAFGAAQFYGSMGGQPLNQPIVGMTATPTGKGYWEVASDGGLFAFGSAQFYGSMGGRPLNEPIVGMAVVSST